MSPLTKGVLPWLFYDTFEANHLPEYDGSGATIIGGAAAGIFDIAYPDYQLAGQEFSPFPSGFMYCKVNTGPSADMTVRVGGREFPKDGPYDYFYAELRMQPTGYAPPFEVAFPAEPWFRFSAFVNPARTAPGRGAFITQHVPTSFYNEEVYISADFDGQRVTAQFWRPLLYAFLRPPAGVPRKGAEVSAFGGPQGENRPQLSVSIKSGDFTGPDSPILATQYPNLENAVGAATLDDWRAEVEMFLSLGGGPPALKRHVRRVTAGGSISLGGRV